MILPEVTKHLVTSPVLLHQRQARALQGLQLPDF